MRAITVKSVEPLEEALQLEIHYSFGMEHHSDYVFKPGGGKIYSATIAIERSETVIDKVVKGSEVLPDRSFILEDLDTESSISTTYLIKGGKIEEKKFSIS